MFGCSRTVLVAAAVVLAAGAAAAPAAALGTRTVFVSSSQEFNRAALAMRDSGGRIVLLPHDYADPLFLTRRSAHPLTVVGTHGARVQTIDVIHAQRIRFERLRIGPVTGDAGMEVWRSTQIVLDRLTVSARHTRFRVEVNLDHSNDVQVQRSDFSHCGDRSPEWSLCLLPNRASHVVVEDNRFHDCRGCDFIHGRAGKGLTIRDNRFARALPCHHGWEKCHHQDMIELFAADGLLVARNRFGLYHRGGAQLYMTGLVDHVRVVNNLFHRRDSRVPGVHSRVGILIGTRATPNLPRDVEVVNNTILAGTGRRGQAPSSIVVSPYYRFQPVDMRPLIANNVLARATDPSLMCLGVRSVRNVVIRGAACSPSDAAGLAYLDPHGRPTSASFLLIDQADPALAPAADLIGQLRDSAPDIGAFEYVPR